MIYQRSTTFWMVFQVVLAAACIGAGWYGGDLALGFACAGLLLVAALAFYVADRRGSSLPALLTGVGDERYYSIYREAMYRTAEMLIYVLMLWAVVVVARGDDNETLLAVIGIFAGLWILNIAWASWAARRPAKSVA